MASSAFTGPSALDYINKRCYCGLVSAIKVSSTFNNPRKLFYTCKLRRCEFFEWCHPVQMKEPSQIFEEEVNSADLTLVRMERELSEIRKTLNALEEKNFMPWMYAVPMAFIMYFCFFILLPT